TTLESLARRTAGEPALAPLATDLDSAEAELDVAATTTVLRTSRTVRLRLGLLSVLTVMVVALVLGVPAWPIFERTGRGLGPAPTRAAGDPAGGAAPSAATPAGSAAPSVSASASGLVRHGGSPVAVVAYGPWQCADVYAWDLGHPVLAKPCHAIGSGIRLIGHM